MDQEKINLGQFEEIVLLAILRLGDNAYGAKIRQKVEEAAGKTISIGAVYATLDRIERKGFISSRQGEATGNRGNRPKRYFKVLGAGVTALNNAQTTRSKLREGLELGFDPTT